MATSNGIDADEVLLSDAEGDSPHHSAGLTLRVQTGSHAGISNEEGTPSPHSPAKQRW